MTVPTRILVPTDFSAHSERAFDYAVELGEKVGATIHLFHAAEIPVLAVPDAPWVATSEVVGSLESAARVALDDLVTQHGLVLGSVGRIVAMGDPRILIGLMATKLGADLICMGTHGRCGIGRVVFGSVAEYVVRTSKVPVLTMHVDDIAA